MIALDALIAHQVSIVEEMEDIEPPSDGEEMIDSLVSHAFEAGRLTGMLQARQLVALDHAEGAA